MDVGGLESLSSEPFCYLTTTGRVTGQPRTIEIWFGLAGNTLYVLSGGGTRSDWVRNLLRTPWVDLRIAGVSLSGTARLVADGSEDRLARPILLEKYQPGYSGDLSGWGRTAVPVAVDLVPDRGQA